MNRYLLLFLLILSSVAILISCSKEHSLESTNYLKAKGTLQDSLGNCYTANVTGNYYAGVALTSNNRVNIQVNVTTPGTYTITTDSVNGFVFKASGTFTNAGVQTVQLAPIGKPVLAQSTAFRMSFDSSICSFTVNVKDSMGSGGGGTGNNNAYSSDTAWRFSESTRSYHGYIDTAYTLDTTVVGQKFKVLQIQGSTATTGDSVILISTVITGNTIIPGTYPSTATGYFQFLGSYNPNDTLYSATFRIPNVLTNMIISSYDPTTKVVKGTFSGTAKNKSNTTVSISSGRFEAKVN